MGNKIKWIFRLFCTSALLFCSFHWLSGQIQIGSDIDGEGANDFSGSSIDMPDQNTIAIGAPNNSGNGQSSGHVRVFQWDGMDWVQKGADINGEFQGDNFGFSVQMPNPNTFAAGAPNNQANGSKSGHVRVFDWDGSAWIQRGGDINGLAGDEAGYAIAMPDANTLAIGSPKSNGGGYDQGHVKVYEWQNGNWIQRGQAIQKPIDGGYLGWALHMPDANTLATAVNDLNSSDTCNGFVFVSVWDGSEWIQKGDSIVSERTEVRCEFSIAMADASTIAVGDHLNSEHGAYHGHVRVFKWEGSTWIQQGTDIEDAEAYQHLGTAIYMADSSSVGVASTYAGNSGLTRVYRWNGQDWRQFGSDIYGEANGDLSGASICMPDAYTLGIGSINNWGAAPGAGHVRVFSLNDISFVQRYGTNIPLYFPNPTSGGITIDFQGQNINGTIIIRNCLGQQVHQQSFSSEAVLEVEIPDTPGLFYVEVQTSKTDRYVFKVIKG